VSIHSSCPRTDLVAWEGNFCSLGWIDECREQAEYRTQQPYLVDLLAIAVPAAALKGSFAEGNKRSVSSTNNKDERATRTSPDFLLTVSLLFTRRKYFQCCIISAPRRLQELSISTPVSANANNGSVLSLLTVLPSFIDVWLV